MKKLFFLVLAIFFIITCGAEETLVTIGGDKISISDFKDFYQFAPTDDSLRRVKIIDDFINQELVVREANSLGYAEDPVVKASMEANRKDIIIRGYYQKNVIDKIKIKESEIRKLYEQFINQYHLAQIVVSSDSLAEIIDQKLDKGVPFESLLAYSLDTISPGGDIGTFSELNIPPEILKVLKKTKPGQIAEPAKLGEFTYFLKVIEYKKSDTPKYEEVKENIKDNLMREQAMTEGQKFIEQLLKQAKIEYNQEGLDLLTKPESLLTEKDLETWVVKKYDTSFVRVKTVITAVQNQLKRAPSIDPKFLIERELIPDLVYDLATKVRAERYPEIKKNLTKALNSIVYQKFYSDNVLEKVKVDSQVVNDYFRQHKSEYPDKKISDVYNQIYIKLRDEQINQLKDDLFTRLREKYQPQINEKVFAKLLKGETK
ncbi:MAG: peptidyl-prolyl cis-trans isomerase [candidate division WOR-3 bacterium]